MFLAGTILIILSIAMDLLALFLTTVYTYYSSRDGPRAWFCLRCCGWGEQWAACISSRVALMQTTYCAEHELAARVDRWWDMERERCEKYRIRRIDPSKRRISWVRLADLTYWGLDTILPLTALVSCSCSWDVIISIYVLPTMGPELTSCLFSFDNYSTAVGNRYKCRF
jgi:hypothetical protein